MKIGGGVCWKGRAPVLSRRKGCKMPERHLERAGEVQSLEADPLTRTFGFWKRCFMTERPARAIALFFDVRGWGGGPRSLLRISKVELTSDMYFHAKSMHAQYSPLTMPSLCFSPQKKAAPFCLGIIQHRHLLPERRFQLTGDAIMSILPLRQFLAVVTNV